MPTLEEIKKQINELDHKYIFYTKKEINYLPEIMLEGERIVALTSGFCKRRTVLAVCTNRRILFLDKGMFFGLRQWQIALDRVQSIDGNYFILFGSIRFWDGAAPININMVLASTIDPFIKAARKAIDEFRRISFHETIGGGSSSRESNTSNGRVVIDVASQIERLAALKEAGHLTEEEFAQQKAKILNM